MARKLALLAVAGVIAAVVFVEFTGVDAPAPSWMRPVIADGRASLYEHIDMINPGSPLTFTHARCRADGAMLVFYTNRWFWVAPSYFVIDVQAGWERRSPPRSFSGGVLDAAVIEYGDDLAGFFEPHGEIACPAEMPAAI